MGIIRKENRDIKVNDTLGETVPLDATLEEEEQMDAHAEIDQSLAEIDLLLYERIPYGMWEYYHLQLNYIRDYVNKQTCAMRAEKTLKLY